ncbi:MAG: hypothetical protein O2892_11535 [Actinomycetota bacterium]|nr:hypothetical protein [Actinomycetota bacterium]MDA2949658.1 hypothetical protein [Actinomycetota bacterium]
MNDTPSAGRPAPERGFQIFNRRNTIGVLVLPGGAVSGLYLDESVRKMTERDLARDILAVASVASMRGRLNIREQIEAAAQADERSVPPQTYEALPDVPTAGQYEQYKTEKLK